MDYCPHCMNPASGPYCPRCGKPTAWTPGEGQLPAGTVLDGGSLHRYSTGAALGQGGFGITYIGMEIESGERVAIKECFPVQCAVRSVDGVRVEAKPGTEGTFQGALTSFLEEARLLARQTELKSVVQVREFFRTNGTAYLIMEFLDGQTLHQRMQAVGKLPAQELLAQLQPLIADLGRLHSSGVIHRDISPDNLMQMADGSIKLLDFGCARSLENGKSVSVLLKHGFAPVEQYQTRGQGSWTDVYALCATIYYCVTGTLPTPAVERLEGGALIPPTQLGADLTSKQETALLWGLEVQPTRRPQTMDMLAQVLYADPPKPDPKPGPTPGPTPGPAPGPRPGPKPAAKGKKGLIIAAAAGVLVVALAAFFALGGRRETAEPNPTLSPPASQAALPSQQPSPSPEAEPGTTYVTDSGYEYTVANGEVCLTGYTGSSTSLSTPDNIDDMPVTAIGEGAFQGNTQIENILMPIYLEEIGADAFADCTSLNRIHAYNTSVVDPSAFDGCDSLRVILKSEEDDITASGWGLSGEVMIYDRGMDTGDGALSSVYVASDGVVYGVTEEDNLVVLDVPNDATEVELLTTFGNYTTTWISDEAIDGTDSDLVIYIDGEILFSPEMAMAATMDIASDEATISLSFCWYASCILAEAIYQDRDGAAEMTPDVELARASMIRAEELTENYGHDRPNGDSWGALLDEMEFNWQHGMERIDNTDSEAFDTILDEMVDNFSQWSDDAEDYYRRFGIGFFAQGDTLYVCAIGTVA